MRRPRLPAVEHGKDLTQNTKGARERKPAIWLSASAAMRIGDARKSQRKSLARLETSVKRRTGGARQDSRRASGARSRLSRTDPTSSQLRVRPLQRSGFARRVLSYSESRRCPPSPSKTSTSAA